MTGLEFVIGVLAIGALLALTGLALIGPPPDDDE